MKYIILSSANREDLEEEVNKYLQSGWRIQGGISLTACTGNRTGNVIYAQALIGGSDDGVVPSAIG